MAKHLSPISLALAALGVTGVATVVALGQFMRAPASECAMPADAPRLATAGTPSRRPVTVAMAGAGSTAVSLREAPSADARTMADLAAQWAAAATGDDATARSAAIWNLGSAAREQALPVLRRVVTSGSVEDRDIALEALGTLAREQGDGDGVIRNVLRETIYHGGDDDVLFTARSTLDAVENQLATEPSGAR